MECKSLMINYKGTIANGINRYIMECKYTFNAYHLCTTRNELIDTLWNVNSTKNAICVNFKVELIDTLWNVNRTNRSRSRRYTDELIDTLWNVNVYSGTGSVVKSQRINRYIMECK